MNDKLTTEQRIRLEALNQAVHVGLASQEPASKILTRAKVFEEYIREGNDIVKTTRQ